MKRDKKIQKYSKKLVALSLGADNFVSEERVAAILRVLGEKPPLHYKALLKAYYNKLKVLLRDETLRVEFFGDLDKGNTVQMEEAFSRRYGRLFKTVLDEAPELLAGVRIQVGDDVWDRSVSGRLEYLSNEFRN